MSFIPGVWLGKKIILNVNSTGPIDEKIESKLPSFSIEFQIYRLTGQTLPSYRNKFSERFGVIWQMLANHEYPMNNMSFSVQVNMDHHPLRTRRPKLHLVITYAYNKYVPHYIMLDHVKKPHVFLAIKWLSHHFLLLVFSWRDNTVSLLLYQWEPP